jgi:predicted alpha/beta superfamily hydrolase
VSNLAKTTKLIVTGAKQASHVKAEASFRTPKTQRARLVGVNALAALALPIHASATTGTKTFYYLSTTAAPQLLVQESDNKLRSYAMINVAPGRRAGERLWCTTGFASAGATVRFKLSDASSADDFETPLNTAWLQDGELYNYRPAGGVSTSRIEVLPAVPSPQGLLPRQLRVYLPRGYDTHTTRRYPVLYMHDGQNIYGTTGATFPTIHWNVDGTLDQLIGMGQVRELIVVGIDNTKDRNTEYVPPGAPQGGLTGGKADKYLAYVRDTVKPLVDSTYRTLPDAQNTGDAGSSLGGIVSTYMGLEAPGTFTRIGAMSPAYWVNSNVVARFDTATTLPAWRHYMDSGTAGPSAHGSPDGMNDCIDARDRLVKRGQVLGRDVLHVTGTGHQHNETAWQARFPQAARFLFPIQDEPGTLPTNPAQLTATGKTYP